MYVFSSISYQLFETESRECSEVFSLTSWSIIFQPNAQQFLKKTWGLVGEKYAIWLLDASYLICCRNTWTLVLEHENFVSKKQAEIKAQQILNFNIRTIDNSAWGHLLRIHEFACICKPITQCSIYTGARSSKIAFICICN